jgi:CRP-like cAMP-binding protein
MAQVRSETNALLDALEPAVRLRFASHFSKVELRRGDVLHHAGQIVDRIYFPLTGLVACHTETVAGESVQTAMIGCDGAVGVLEAFGSGQYLSRGVIQIPGDALRLSVARYGEVLDSSPGLQTAVELHLELLVTEARQLMACTALHSIEGRLSRSILDALDRSCLDRVLPLTQDALAQMLGAQRTTVATTISKLQRKGLIKSGRRTIEVLDVAGLEQVACSCRETLRLAREEVFAPAMTQNLRSYG